jgi:hypothetical protein
MDDVPPSMQMIESQGTKEGLPIGARETMASCAAKILRVKPTRIISFGLLHEHTQPGQTRAAVSNCSSG